jgi:hypothetical protein
MENGFDPEMKVAGVDARKLGDKDAAFGCVVDLAQGVKDKEPTPPPTPPRKQTPPPPPPPKKVAPPPPPPPPPKKATSPPPEESSESEEEGGFPSLQALLGATKDQFGGMIGQRAQYEQDVLGIDATEAARPEDFGLNKVKEEQEAQE